MVLSFVVSLVSFAGQSFVVTSIARYLPAPFQWLAPTLGWACTCRHLSSRTLTVVLVGQLCVCGVTLARQLYNQHAARMFQLPVLPTLATLLFRLVRSLVSAGGASPVASASPGYARLFSTLLIGAQLWSLVGGVLTCACYPATVLQMAQVTPLQLEEQYLRNKRAMDNDGRRITQRYYVEGNGGAKLDVIVARRPNARRWVLYMGGNAEFAEFSLGYVRPLADDLDASLILFNQRGIGRSTGYVSQVSCLCEDASAVVEAVCRKEAIDPRWLLLLGHSIGGGVAATVAARKCPQCPLVLDRTFSSLSDAAVGIVDPVIPPAIKPFVPHIFKFFVGDLDTVRGWNAVTQHVNKLVLYTVEDEIISYRLASMGRLAQFHNGAENHRALRITKRGGNNHNSDLNTFSEHLTIVAKMAALYPKR